MDLSPRKLRYFIAVAEELNFGRAAARLYIAQQSLSAQIKELEEQLGVKLFHRTTRKVELTSAGTVMLAAARTALATLDDAVQEAHRAELGEVGTLKVGFTIGAALELTQPILAGFRQRLPEVQLELREFGFDDLSAGLTDGWADIAFVRLPTSTLGIETETLFVEPRVLAVALGHPLAARESVQVAELLELPLSVGAGRDAVNRDFWTLTEHRAGSKPPRVIDISSQSEENLIVAAGEACCVTAASVGRFLPHTGIRHIPITDIGGSSVALAWPAHRRTALVDRFRAVAREICAEESELMQTIEHPFELD